MGGSLLVDFILSMEVNFEDLRIYFEASRGTEARSVTVKSTGFVFDPHSSKLNIYLNLYFHFFALVARQSAALSSATQWQCL